MKIQYAISVPQTELTLSNEKKLNKFLENLKGLISEKTKERSILDGVTEFMDIWKALKVAETTQQLIVGEADYKKLQTLLKDHKGWGDFAGQIECWEAVETAVKTE